MKKTLIIALAVMAGALLNTADAKKKKEAKKAAEVETVKPLELSSSSDTLSYAAGMMLTDGLMPYLKQSGVDTAYMAKFIEGFETVANAGDNPEMKAYVMGMEIANRMKEQMLGRMKNDLKDAPDSIIDAIAYRGFVDGLTSNTAVYDTKRASEMFKLKFEAAKKAKEEKLCEAHRKYLDVQYIVEGEETVGWAPLETLTLEGEFNTEKDIGRYAGPVDCMRIGAGYCYVVLSLIHISEPTRPY